MSEIPTAYWNVVAFLFGAIIGSFLNVVIYRLPTRSPQRGVLDTLSHPDSHCPNCDHKISALENIPMLSFLVLGRRCRNCKQPISWRYFGVELLTACLFLALETKFGPTIETVAYCLFSAALIAAFFIDWERYIIPDELNTFALCIGIGLDVWGIAMHKPGHTLLWGWLPRSILGAMICAAIFVFIQLLGLLLFRKEAMGDGDVKLARAVGAMLPIGQALVSFLLAIGAGAVLGGALALWAAQKSKSMPQAVETHRSESEEAEEEDTPITFAELCQYGFFYIFFLDLVWQAADWLRRGRPAAEEAAAEPEEDDFVAGPTHIPFGPYMVVGAMLAVFYGDKLIRWYLEWTRLNA